jgi:hypothetical protein
MKENQILPPPPTTQNFFVQLIIKIKEHTLLLRCLFISTSLQHLKGAAFRNWYDIGCEFGLVITGVSNLKVADSARYKRGDWQTISQTSIIFRKEKKLSSSDVSSSPHKTQLLTGAAFRYWIDIGDEFGHHCSNQTITKRSSSQ